MTRNVAEVLEAAKALSRAERAEVAQQLLSTLDSTDVSDKARIAALRASVDAGVAGLEAGEHINIPIGELREYLRERGRMATQRAATTT